MWTPRVFKTKGFARATRRARAQATGLVVAVAQDAVCRDGISDAEVAGFRRLASAYATLGETAIAAMITNGDWTEICDDSEVEVQE